MTITLHKLLALAVSPLVLVMGLLVWGALRRSRATVLLAVALLYLASMPLVARPFFRWVEQQQVRLAPQAVPAADAIVVLSGMLRDVSGPSGSVPEWGDAADRLFGPQGIVEHQSVPDRMRGPGKDERTGEADPAPCHDP